MRQVGEAGRAGKKDTVNGGFSMLRGLQKNSDQMRRTEQVRLRRQLHGL